MYTSELPDIDGDALTLIRDGDSTWITCTSGREEVTVGPFSPSLLRIMLADGAHESPAEGVLDLAVTARQGDVEGSSFCWGLRAG